MAKPRESLAVAPYGCPYTAAADLRLSVPRFVPAGRFFGPERAVAIDYKAVILVAAWQ